MTHVMSQKMLEELWAKMRSGSATEEVGKASAAFAQQLWNGKVDDTLLMSMLNDSSDVVRSEVAWAIADAHRPLAGTRWLITKGLVDSAEGVRFWATRYLLEADVDITLLAKDAILKMENDESQRVRDNVRDLLDRIRDVGGGP